MNIDLKTDDLAGKRLAEAVSRNAKIANIVETVSNLHAVRASVIRSPGKLVRRPHVVLARAHAAWLMDQDGIRKAHIGRALGCDPSAAHRGIRRWEDYKAGRRDKATEGQVWQVKAKVEQGATVNDACAEVGIARSKYDSRATTMKLEGKL